MRRIAPRKLTDGYGPELQWYDEQFEEDPNTYQCMRHEGQRFCRKLTVNEWNMNVYAIESNVEGAQ